MVVYKIFSGESTPSDIINKVLLEMNRVSGLEFIADFFSSNNLAYIAIEDPIFKSNIQVVWNDMSIEFGINRYGSYNSSVLLQVLFDLDLLNATVKLPKWSNKKWDLLSKREKYLAR